MRSISIAALAVLACATHSVAERQNTPQDDGKTTVTTSTSTTSDDSETLVVPVYVYVGPDGKSSTTTGKASTKTAAGTIAAKSSPTSVKAGSVTKAGTDADTTTSSDGSLLGNLGKDLSSLLNPSPVGSTTGLPTSIVQPTTTVTSHSHTTSPTHSASTSSDPGNFLSSLLGWPEPSSSSGIAPSSSVVPGITVGLSSVYVSTTASPTSTGTASGSASASTSSSPGLLSIPPLSSLFPDPSTSKTGTRSSSVAVPTSSHPSVGPTSTSASASVKPSGSASVIPTTKTGTGSVTPSQPATPSQSPPNPSGSVSPNGSSRPVTTKPTTTTSSHSVSPSVTQVTSKPSEPAATTSTSTSTSTSQSSTASDTPYVPPPVITPTATSTGSGGPEPTSPAQIPEVILPPGGTPQTPANSTLVQFGFNKALSWPTVATSMNWPDQIYYYTPIGVSYALAIAQDKVTPFWLGPYDTVASLGYNTTLIKFFIPSDLVDTLNALRSAPASDLYQQPNTPNDKPTYDQSSIKNLFSMLNTDIPLVAQQPSGSSNPGSGDGSNSGSSGGNGNANPGDGGASTSSGVRASSVGIGVGAAAGAAAYAGAMFYVARRYRKRKQLHQRSSSVPSASMSEAGNTPFISARNTQISHNSGRSGRTAMISAPVMSENSLGWN